MTLNVPLAVRLQTAAADMHITRQVRDIEFRSTATGGFASCAIKLDRSLTADPPEIALYGRLYVYDRRSGRTVWEGRQEDPGRTVSSDGQVWDLNAVGPAAHLHDRTVPLIYVDTNFQNWVPMDVTVTPHGTVNITNDPAVASGAPTMTMQFPNNTPLVTNSRVVHAYPLLRGAGQKMGRYNYSWDAGRTLSTLRVQSVTRDGAGGGAVGRDEAFNTAGGAASGQVIATNFANTRDWLEARILWNGGAATVGDDVTWAAFIGLTVQGTRYDKSGVELLTGASYPADTILASDVVADLLGRLLTQYDGANATITATTYPIDQLAYPDGIDPGGVLDDLTTLEPLYTYAAWESNPYTSTTINTAKWRFEWRQWPTTTRYEATVVDGFSAPGSGSDLWNAVRVRYKTPTGVIATVRRTSTVADLDNAGLTREAIIDLGDTVGSAANAAQVGDQFLTQYSSPPNAGRLTIGRPIVDHDTGRRVPPWDIRPGYLIAVHGVSPHVDTFNATSRDGSTIFQISAATFRASTGTMELELDAYPQSVTAALAKLQRRQPTTGPIRRR